MKFYKNLNIRLYDLILRVLRRLRVMKLKFIGVNVGKNVKVYGRVIIGGNPLNIKIEDNVTLNEGVLLNGRDKIIIKKNSRISSNVQIHTGYLNLDLDKHKKRIHFKDKIIICENVWIASGAIIGAGTKIGKNTVVGANSVVVGKNLEPDSFYAGVPVKLIRELKK